MDMSVWYDLVVQSLVAHPNHPIAELMRQVRGARDLVERDDTRAASASDRRDCAPNSSRNVILTLRDRMLHPIPGQPLVRPLVNGARPGPSKR